MTRGPEDTRRYVAREMMDTVAEEGVGEWRTVRLDDLCARITSGGTPERSRLDYYADDSRGHSWVKSSELQDGYVRETDERVSDLGLQESAAKLLPAQAVLIAMYGATAGRVGLLTIDAAVNQAVCALVLNRAHADPVFVFHALRSQYPELAGKSAGAAQQNLNANIIKSFPLTAPGLATQRRIAAVLSAFDELIEINERRIELLEHLARSLYREWFVHFRFPGHEDVELVDSELGPIPEGWTVRPVGDVLDLVGGGTPSKKQDEYWANGTIPWFTPSDLTRSRKRFVSDSTVRITDLGLAKSSAHLFAPGSVLMTSRATLGVLAIATRSAACNQGFIVLPPASGIAPAFIYEWLLSQAADLEQIATGATFKEITKGAFKRFPFLLPPAGLLSAFGQASQPVDEQIALLEASNRQLAATRDLLLPRLVTGRLDISDVDLGILTPTAAE